jgi:RNA polymerase sigma-70 factor (ECF subfamily)
VTTTVSAPSRADPAAGLPREAEVCRDYAPRLRAIALRHLRDRSAADDVVQEVLAAVVVALRAGRIGGPELIGPYALSVCRRRIADLHRSAARRSALHEQLEPALAATTCASEPPALDLEQMLRALSPLSGRERQIVSETFSAERSAAEIAEALGTTAAHVRVLRHRALAKMRAALGWEDQP